MIYLDNSATTFPKPSAVREMLNYAPLYYGANPGRSGYKMGNDTARMIYKVRESVAEMFSAESEENVVFTLNCTHSLNIAIKGLSKYGGHAVTSCLEHNSVMRPLKKLCKDKNFTFDIAKVYDDDEKTVESFEKKIKRNTNFIVCTYASNVFGDILPIQKIGKLAKKYNIPLIVDAAQAAGVIDINVKRDNVSCLCMPGHKGLYGPTGTGLLVLNNGCLPDTLVEGGTGSESKNLLQPDFLPDRYESGTINTFGILALGKGIEFVKKEKISRIVEYESELIGYLYKSIVNLENIVLYNKYNPQKFVPILSFNICDFPGEKSASLLSEKGIAVRGGFHCNPSAHEHYYTITKGTVRASVSAFNTKNDIKFLIKFINQIAKTKKV